MVKRASRKRTAKSTSPTRAQKRKKGDPNDVRTLCIDIGGTGIKGLTVDHLGHPLSKRIRLPTPAPAKPAAVFRVLKDIIRAQPRFDRISVGFPGVVMDGVVKRAPNLHPTWAGVALARTLERLTKKPTRVLNDAGVQGFGVIEGKGVELVLTLGTGMGCGLFVDGRYVPNLELAHHPFRKGKTYEEWVGNRALKKIGKRRWNKRVRQVIDQVEPIWNYRKLYLGGGNAKKIEIVLPKNVRVVENVAGLLGGIALWRIP